MSTIVLAHGLFGFGDKLPGFSSIFSLHYFNGVKAHLEARGHSVFAFQVNPVGSIVERGNQLADSIRDCKELVDTIHIIAHSMGGLDARHAITNRPEVGARVATLVTIGTPHKGSPVADAIVDPSNKLRAQIPDFLLRQVDPKAGAILDLTTQRCSDFDARTKNVKSVRYIEIAGDASEAHKSLLFDLAAEIGKIHGINDGVVAKTSALHEQGTEHLPDWPTDHGGEIGWSFDSPVPIVERSPLLPHLELPLLPAASAHLQRYDAIVALLKGKPATAGA